LNPWELFISKNPEAQQLIIGVSDNFRCRLTLKAFGPILVTGASSGIGRTVTEFLSSRGYTVFAGVRKEADFATLSHLPYVTAIRLDVTDPDDIQKCVARLHSEGNSVYGLVNNAGVSDYRPLIDSSVEQLHRVFNVNLYGIHLVTRALVPFLIESKGRVINMSSVSGFLTPKFVGAYSISKHAVEAYSDTLREELGEFGIRVSMIEPGDFRSNITANILPILKKEELLRKSRYRDELANEIRSRFEFPERLSRTVFPAPHKVAQAVSDALFSENPKPRYFVGNMEEVKHVIERILEILVQVNETHEHSLNKNELIDMLGKALNKGQ